MSKMHENKTWKIAGKLEVNRLGYGAMRITGRGILGYPADEGEAIQVLKKAIESGVNFIDTADSYGPGVSEQLIAKALHPYPDHLVIATKGGQDRPGPDEWVPNGRPDHLKKVLETSLRNLKLEQIALYQLHRRDPEVPFDETVGFLKEAQDKGLIKYIGLSEVNVESIQQAQQQIEIVSLQNRYSVDRRKWEKELQFCAENDIAFIPWAPMNGLRSDTHQIIENMAQKYGVSSHQLMLRWLFNHSGNILLIPGTSKVKHLEENVKSQDISLEQEDFKTLSNLNNN